MNQFTFAFDDVASEPQFTMAVGEQPQQRLENFGVKAVSDTELLAMLLGGGGTRVEQAIKMASRLIAEAGSIAGLASWEASDYRRIKGIGHIKGLQLATIAEIARRMMMPKQSTAPLLNRPELIAEYFRPIVQGLVVEKFYVILLNRKNRLIKYVEVTSGTATAALAHPREVFRTVLRQASCPVTSVAVLHNHPSGFCEASAADIHVTRVLREASKALDIELTDHLIIGDKSVDPTGKGYHSFREAGLL